jgi:hypothetical protein
MSNISSPRLHPDLVTVFESDWIQTESKGIFGTVGLLVLSSDGTGFPYTVNFSKGGSSVSDGWHTSCEGVLTVNENDHDWFTMAGIIRKDSLTANDRNTLREIFAAKLFTQLAALTLDHPISSNRFLILLSRIDTKFHAIYADYAGKIKMVHTCTYAGGRWNVTPGLVGDISRIFIMNAERTREYMTKLRAAQAAGFFYGFIAWAKFFWWYNSWAKTSSKVLGGSSSSDVISTLIS